MKNFYLRLSIACLVAGSFLLPFSHTFASQAQHENTDALAFSNTQTWLPRYLQWAENAADIPAVALPLAPKNSSRKTRAELATLHAYQNTRTNKNIEQIKQEINIYDALFGEETFAQLVDESKRPLTFELITEVIQLESPQIMKQKKFYDRVRPSHLDPTLRPVIEVPPHPAYPSGHATQAHLRALVLSALDPKHRKVYLQSAKRIARNREIAGVHYPSDSQAGFILAEQLFGKLIKNPDFKKRLHAAKSEW